MTERRLGMLGGTFDPPHIGHLIVAQDVVEGLELDRLIVVPAGDPPHKAALFPPDVRLRLTRIAFEGIDRTEVSDVEIRRRGSSYTVDTLAWIRQRFAPQQLFCIVGADQFRVIDSWHEYRRLSDLAQLVVMRRGGEEVPPGPVGISARTVEVTRVDLSSSLIRDRLREGRSIRYLVPASIHAAVMEAWQTLCRASGGAPQDASKAARPAEVEAR